MSNYGCSRTEEEICFQLIGIVTQMATKLLG